MSMKRALALLLSVSLGAGVLTGCGATPAASSSEPVVSAPASSEAASASSEAAKPAKSVELRVVTSYGGNDGNRGNFENALKGFEAATGHKVNNGSAFSDENWKVQIMNDFQLGAEPDVLFFYNGADSNNLVKDGKVVSIEEIRKVYPDYATNMKDEMMGASPVDGKNYSVPVNGYWESMFVNKKVLDDCGVAVPGENYTWEQFLEDCETVKAKGYTPIAISIHNMPNYWFEFLIYNYTSSAIHNTMPATADDEVGQKWLKGLADMKTLYDKGYFPENTLSCLDDEAVQLMADDKAAFQIDGSWKVGWYEENKAESLEDIVMAFPPSNGGERKATDLIGGISMGYFITTKAYNDPEKQQACVDFVKYMTSDEVVSTFCAAGNVTALKNGVIAATDASALVKSVNAMNAKVTGIAPAVQDNMDNESVRTPFFDNMKNIVTGNADAAAILAETLAAQTDFVARTAG